MPLANPPTEEIKTLVDAHILKIHRSSVILNPWKTDDYNPYSAHAIYLMSLQFDKLPLKFPDETPNVRV